MIDPKLFTVERLLAQLFDHVYGNRDVWRRQAEIIVGYMPQFPTPNTRPSVVVRFEASFLRHSKGPRQGHTWDIYGDDYMTAELALLALLEAPIPPSAIHPRVWTRHREARSSQPAAPAAPAPPQLPAAGGAAHVESGAAPPPGEDRR